MNNLKKIIILLCVIFILMVIAIVIYKAVKPESDYWTEKNEVEEYVVNTTVRENTSLYDFFIIKNILEEYYSHFEGMNKTIRDIILDVGDEYDESYDYNKDLEKEKEMHFESLYNCLGEEFISEWGININNIKEKLGNYKETYVSIDKVYKADSSSKVSIYFVYGNIIEKATLEKESFKFILLLDMTQNTYKIYPTEYVEKYYNDILNVKNIDISVEKIEDKIYNTFEYGIVSEEEKIQYYIQEYNKNIIYNIEKAYTLLDKDYRKDRFGSIENFKKYVSDEINDKGIIFLDKYQVNVYDDYTQYVCVDTNGKYYIFNETAVMEYKVMLDTYTVDIPQFIEKYENANEPGKVAMNINKFISAINDKNYNYAYDCLSDGFKKNYFNTIEVFVKYIQEKFYNSNEVEYISCKEQSGLYRYSITIENAKDKEKTFTKNIIMKLNEGTNFEMSFNLE